MEENPPQILCAFLSSGFCGVLRWQAGHPVDLIFSSTLVGGFNASSKGAPVGFPVSSAALPLLTPSHLLPYTGGFPTISKASFTSSFLMSFTDTQWEPPAHSTLTTSIGPQPVGQFWLETTCQTSLAFIDGSNHTLSNKI